MASKRERGDGWQVQWRDSKGVQKSRQVPSERLADRLIAEIDRAKALGEDWRPRDNAPAADLTEMMQTYLEHIAHVRAMAPATVEQAKIGLELFLRYLRTIHPRGKLWPDALTRDRVEGFFLWMRRDRVWKGRRGMSQLTAFQHARKVCRAWEWLHDRYPGDVAAPVEVALPDSQPEVRPYAPTWADCDAAIAALRVEWQRRLWTFLRFTGLRRGQAMRLTWDAIDLDAALLTVPGELGKSRQERRGRVVPLTPALVTEMAGWGKREGFIIQTQGNVKGNARAIDYEAFRRAWREGTGRPMPQPFHALRRAFMTGLRERGVALDVIQYLVGHRRGTAGDVYMSAAAVMAEARAAVALIPAVGEAPAVTALSTRRAK